MHFTSSFRAINILMEKKEEIIHQRKKRQTITKAKNYYVAAANGNKTNAHKIHAPNILTITHKFALTVMCLAVVPLSQCFSDDDDDTMHTLPFSVCNYSNRSKIYCQSVWQLIWMKIFNRNLRNLAASDIWPRLRNSFWTRNTCKSIKACP